MYFRMLCYSISRKNLFTIHTWGQQTNLENTLKDFAKYSYGGTMLITVEYSVCTYCAV